MMRIPIAPVLRARGHHVRMSLSRRNVQPFSTRSCLGTPQGMLLWVAIPLLLTLPLASVHGHPSKPSLLRQAAGFVAIATLFTSAGFIITAAPAMWSASSMLNPPSDEDTLSMFNPEDDTSREVEQYIQNHPLTYKLRLNSKLSESRPHLRIPESQKGHNLTGGTLLGPGKVIVPPLTWSEKGGKSLISISHLGKDLCGHPGIIHGGLLATMLDEGMAKCCFAALPNKVGMTANLKVNYRAPAPADAVVVLIATTTKVEGRKAWVEGRIETLVAEGEIPTVLVEASALFIEPKQAAVCLPSKAYIQCDY